MNRKEFIKNGILLAATPALHPLLKSNTSAMKNQYRLLRHATLVIKMAGVNILIDPMLSAKDAMEPVANAANNNRIPMVDLPLNGAELNTLLKSIDAVMVTHMHRDHWDVAAHELINKQVAIFCQPEDAAAIKSKGFVNVVPVAGIITYKGITISRTGGHHGSGEIEKNMGIVSGFVLKDETDTVYIAGDTIWCDEVKEALIKHQPTITILNTGAPKFLTGGPITMGADDVITTCRTLPTGKIVAVHMETVNHCTLNRAQLKTALQQAGLAGRVSIPADGEYF